MHAALLIDWIVLKVSVCFFLSTEVPRKLFSVSFSSSLFWILFYILKCQGWRKQGWLPACLCIRHGAVRKSVADFCCEFCAGCSLQCAGQGVAQFKDLREQRAQCQLLIKPWGHFWRDLEVSAPGEVFAFSVFWERQASVGVLWGGND